VRAQDVYPLFSKKVLLLKILFIGIVQEINFKNGNKWSSKCGILTTYFYVKELLTKAHLF